MSLRIALMGYGKMGKAIEAEAIRRGHSVCQVIGREGLDLIADLRPSNCDCVIEFTRPESALGNFRRLLPTGIPIVTGTTGWMGDLEVVRGEVADMGGSFIYSSNYSVGVNVLFQLNKVLARLMNGLPEYDCFVEEAHHRHKKDAPSGTAHTLAAQIIHALGRKTRVADASLRHRAPEPEELSVAYTRAGEIVGEHTVTYISDVDRIGISHEAFNRRGFALGAVIAAEWVQGKKGFFEFGEVFEGVGM
jgi:4-hydroxy-tetrahydrodipicolinate reductase